MSSREQTAESVEICSSNKSSCESPQKSPTQSGVREERPLLMVIKCERCERSARPRVGRLRVRAPRAPSCMFPRWPCGVAAPTPSAGPGKGRVQGYKAAFEKNKGFLAVSPPSVSPVAYSPKSEVAVARRDQGHLVGTLTLGPWARRGDAAPTAGTEAAPEAGTQRVLRNRLSGTGEPAGSP